MRLSVFYIRIGHLLCGFVLAGLLVVLAMRIFDRPSNLLLETFHSCTQNFSIICERFNARQLHIIKEHDLLFPSEAHRFSAASAEVIDSGANQAFLLLDSLDRYPSEELVGYSMASHQKYLREVDALMPIGHVLRRDIQIEVGNPSFMATRARYYHKMLSSIIRIRTEIIQSISLGYCAERSEGISCLFDFPVYMCVTQLAPTIGQKIEADIVFTPPDPVPVMTFVLNGKVYPTKEGLAHYSNRYTKPGNYPLHFVLHATDILTDSIHSFEKTYWLTVRE